MKVAITAFLSIMILSILNGIVTLDAYVLIMSLVNLTVPVLIGTIVYHYTIEFLSQRLPTFQKLAFRILLGSAVALILMIGFLLADGVYNRSVDWDRFFNDLKDRILIVLGAGTVVSVIHAFIGRVISRVSTNLK